MGGLVAGWLPVHFLATAEVPLIKFTTKPTFDCTDHFNIYSINALHYIDILHLKCLKLYSVKIKLP